MMLLSAIGRAAACGSGLVLALAAMLCAAMPVAAQRTVLQVGDRQVEVSVAGGGGPAVVFEAGFRNDLTTWSGILPRVAEYTTAVSYSRGGYGESTAAAGVRSPATIVAELRATLRELGIAPPYILVGHSLGGLYVRHFALAHPDEVAGIVLVDASHERQTIEVARREPGVWEQRQRRRGELVVEAPRIIGEFDGFTGALEAGSPGIDAPLPDVPLVVLTSMHVTGAPGFLPSAAGRLVWRDLHAEWFQAVTNGMHITTSRSGHFIHLDEPALVMNAIRWVFDRAAVAPAHQLSF